jgi:hypothetical protein
VEAYNSLIGQQRIMRKRPGRKALSEALKN